jgi:beta-lactamase class D
MSTFKIPNALIGADVGLLDGPDAVMPYDPRFPVPAGGNPAWGQDQTLTRALEISAVPLFRRLAADIGAERMQAHLDAFHYGNHSIEGGLTEFWLSGKLAISAVEQVDFLGQLTAGTLPVSDRALATVRAALPSETHAGATLHHKTGTGPLDGGPWVGWLVGWVDRPEGAYPFACWIQHAPADVDVIRAYRLRVCRGALERAGLFPAG